MTAQQLERIAALRAQNYPYSFIGRELGLPSNTVKSICRRKGFPVTGSRKTKIEKQSVFICKNCFRIIQNDSPQKRLFCSEKCRMEWWKTHRRSLSKDR